MASKKKTRTCIGGQAVLEGVMMRGESSMAMAIRTEDGQILTETHRLKPIKERNIAYRIPFVRGVLSFVDSMVGGVKITTRSGAVFDYDAAEPSKFDKWLSKHLHVSAFDIAVGIGVILGLFFSIALFILAPQFIVSALVKYANFNPHAIVKNLVEGSFRLLIFILYILAISLLKDIKRVFMYHGAEHKTINCFESGMELTVENIQKQSTIHDRCGTTFMFLVMVISILFISLTGWVGNIWLRILFRLLLMPIIAGVSYEILKFFARFDNWFVSIIKAPGLLLQKITTKKPDDSMVEVALTAFNLVAAMDKDPTIKEVSFNLNVPYEKAREKVKKVLEKNKDIEECDLDWIMCEVLKVKRSELALTHFVKEDDLDIMLDYANKRVQNQPLQHIFGYSEFYGYKIKVNGDVLCPRFETEILVETAIKTIDEDSDITSVLDLCTGSGCIAIAIKGERAQVSVAASDISKEALAIAKENILVNNLEKEIELIESNLLDEIEDKYQMIVCNPPYIKSSEIETLSADVKDHDPIIALDGGESGLNFYQKIANQLDKFSLYKYIIFEMGINQAEDIKNIFNKEGYAVEIIKDLEGVDRIAKITIRR